jgi:NADH-quinone oxidoreductase subunit G
LLHTYYSNRKRIEHEEVELSAANSDIPLLDINVCFGTSCYLRGAQELYKQVVQYLKDKGVEDQTRLKATFCNERCKRGPVITINGNVLEKCSPEMAKDEISRYLS